MTDVLAGRKTVFASDDREKSGERTKLEGTTVLLATLGGALALLLLVLALVSQGSQGLFQINRPAVEYAALSPPAT